MRCEPTRGAHATHCTHNIKELHKYLSFNFSISNIKAAKITQRASWAAPDLRAHPARPLGAVAPPGAEMGGVTRPALRSAGGTAFSPNSRHGDARYSPRSRLRQFVALLHRIGPLCRAIATEAQRAEWPRPPPAAEPARAIKELPIAFPRQNSSGKAQELTLTTRWIRST